MKTWSLSIVAVLLVACSGGESTGTKSANEKAVPAGAPPAAIPVSVAAAIERDVQESDEFSGRLEAFESVEIRSRVSGVIQSVHFQAGREVRRGDLLFTVDARAAAAELAKADAELARQQTRADLARAEFARSERLLSSKAISQQEFDQATATQREAGASIRAAQAQVDAARLQVEFTRVTAPINGRLSRAEVTQGNFVTGGLPGSTLLTTLVSIDPIYVSFEGDEQLYLRYQKATLAGGGAARTVAMGLANEDGFPRSGKLDFIDNRLDPKTGTIRVRAVFPNADRFLTPGLFARIKLLSGRTYRATMVSDRAVGTDQSPKFLLVVGDNNALQYRPVKLGGTANGLRIIQEGLRPGERIVVNGLQRVRPGAIVQPQMVAMDADPNAPTASAPKPATNAAPEGAPSKPPSGVEIKKGADAAK